MLEYSAHTWLHMKVTESSEKDSMHSADYNPIVQQITDCQKEVQEERPIS